MPRQVLLAVPEWDVESPELIGLLPASRPALPTGFEAAAAATGYKTAPRSKPAAGPQTTSAATKPPSRGTAYPNIAANMAAVYEDMPTDNGTTTFPPAIKERRAKPRKRREDSDASAAMMEVAVAKMSVAAEQ